MMVMVYDRLGREIYPGALLVKVSTDSLYMALRQKEYLDGVEIFQMPVENASSSLIGGQCLPLVADPGEWVREVEVVRYVLPPWSRGGL